MADPKIQELTTVERDAFLTLYTAINCRSPELIGLVQGVISTDGPLTVELICLRQRGFWQVAFKYGGTTYVTCVPESRLTFIDAITKLPVSTPVASVREP
jgi:hypothetical protein